MWNVRTKTASFLLIGLLASCAVPTGTVGFTDPSQRDQAISAFRAGRARLDCGMDRSCMPRWFGDRTPQGPTANGNRREYAVTAVASGDWNGLAETVLASGLDSDLHWYYLGRAAQGMGLPAAARTYYQRSIARTRAGGGQACGNLIPCDNANLPREAQTALAAVTPRRPAAAPSEPAATEPVALAPPASTWVRPAEPPPIGAGAGPSVSVGAGAAAPAGWVSPAPVSRP